MGETVLDQEKRSAWLEKRQRKIEEKEAERLERFADRHEEGRQGLQSERKKCPTCHQFIAEKFIETVYDVPLFDRSDEDQCVCSRDVVSQTRRLFLDCTCFNSRTSIAMCQFPNGFIASSVCITTGKSSKTYALRGDEVVRSFFESMEDLENTLNHQTIVHDWSIRWIDAL